MFMELSNSEEEWEQKSPKNEEIKAQERVRPTKWKMTK